MSALPISHYSIEDYLEIERGAKEKSEYFAGEIFMMAGASIPHNRINENLSGEFYLHLKRKKCQSFSQDLRIHIPENLLFTYPDLVVVCDEPILYDEQLDTVLNPSLIVEILSKSTASYDRGEKFALYRKISTLREYVLIDSEKVLAEVWQKNKDDIWILAQETESISDNISFASIQFNLPLADVYNNSNVKSQI